MVQRTAINVVWFKRDLRLVDHAPLAHAAGHPVPVLLLYVFEPQLVAAPDFDIRHGCFVWQSLQNLQRMLGTHHLCIAHGCVQEVLAFLLQEFDILHLLSHEETGNRLSYERDKAVNKWCRSVGIGWLQFPHKGVVRGSDVRRGWSKQWFQYAAAPIEPINWNRIDIVKPFDHPFQLAPNSPFAEALAAAPKTLQPGGATVGEVYLNGFISERCLNYQAHISKPAESRVSCSRLSPYLAYGNLSLRQVYQAAQLQTANHGVFKKQLKFFQQRLLWHGHFVQKFETLCSIESENMNPGFNGIRTHVNYRWLEAWKTGNTGVPLVDACMRCLHTTGYLNFRMRAMLVSFLTHYLWQPWQAGAHHLAQLFLDYEPGIHYPQFQMQAGVTGINTIRIYNPVKQGLEHDAEGSFVKKWLPELHALPKEFVHQPWLLNVFEQKAYQCVLGHDYPHPVVDLAAAASQARTTLWKVKRSAEVRQLNKHILGVLTERASDFDQDA
jgi:deoxyribodipyrimidine photo-lyase